MHKVAIKDERGALQPCRQTVTSACVCVCVRRSACCVYCKKQELILIPPGCAVRGSSDISLMDDSQVKDKVVVWMNQSERQKESSPCLLVVCVCVVYSTGPHMRTTTSSLRHRWATSDSKQGECCGNRVCGMLSEEVDALQQGSSSGQLEAVTLWIRKGRNEGIFIWWWCTVLKDHHQTCITVLFLVVKRTCHGFCCMARGFWEKWVGGLM